MSYIFEGKVFEMSSYSERKALKLIDEEPADFVKHSNIQLCRIYPAGTRTDSSNYSPVDMWNVGCQLGMLCCILTTLIVIKVMSGFQFSMHSLPFINDRLQYLFGVGCSFVLQLGHYITCSFRTFLNILFCSFSVIEFPNPRSTDAAIPRKVQGQRWLWLHPQTQFYD